MRFRLRWLLIVVGIAGPLLYLVRQVGYEVAYGVDDAYAQWGAADMVIDYMNDHDGEWPRSWDSLSPYFADSNGRVGGWSYKKYQERVWIDFDADPLELEKQALESDRASFNVIDARFTNFALWGDGPDQQVHSYFLQRLTQSSASSANSAVNP
jgi:hypothetical protein